MPNIDSISSLEAELRQFATERDWEQFHSPKNLAMALAVEAAELLEPFQWLTQEQSRDAGSLNMEQIRHEMADVFIYLVRMADQLDIDLLGAAAEKLAVNRDKYPAERVKGSAKKYSEYSDD